MTPRRKDTARAILGAIFLVGFALCIPILAALLDF